MRHCIHYKPIRDRSQLFTIYFSNDSFQNLPVFLIKQINDFNEQEINSNKSHQNYTISIHLRTYSSFKAALTAGKVSMLGNINNF